MNVFKEIEKSLEAYPNSLAIVNFRTEKSLSSSALLKMVADLAKIFSLHLPSEKSIIAISLVNSEEAVACVLAIWSLGHAVMPLPTRIPPAEIDVIMANGPAAILIFSSSKDEGSSIGLIHGLTLRRFRANRPPAFPTEELAFVRFTSGTTEQARGVLISHEAINERCKSFSQVLNLSHGRSTLWHLDMAFHFTTSIVSFLLHNCTIHLGQLLIPSRFASWLETHPIDYFFSMPFFYDQLASMETALKCQNTQFFVTGQALSEKAFLLFQKRHGQRLRRMYGVIEIGIPALLSDAEDPQIIGPEAPSYELKIVNPNSNGTGTIHVKSPGPFLGYLMGHKYKFEPFDGGWFNTGDLGRITDSGDLMIEGRAKEQIHLAGQKFFPSQVESVLNSMPGIYGSAAFTEGDPPILAIAFTSEKAFTSFELMAWMRLRLERGQVPEKYLRVNKLATTPSGKILRSAQAYRNLL